MSDKNRVTYIGTTDFRNQQVKFGIKAIDRSRHMYIIGKTGMGKSTVLENLAVQDIANGDGMVFIDPHGSAIEKLLDYVPEHRINDVIYFAPFDTDFPISFNVMENIEHDRRHLVVSGLMASFKKIWQDAWSARMEYILTNTLLALMETPNSTLLGVNRMYADKAYRDMIIANVTDNSVKTFWLDEFNKWDVKFMREATAAIQNKIGQFTGNPLIRNIIGQTQSSFDFRRAMDERKIILINLSKGLIGEENMRLLGGMIITKLYLAAMSRADVGTYALDTLPPCYFFVDEFQNFANESFADILAEARKYKLNLTVANQYIAQMEESVRDAIFGNVGTTIAFRVGPFDAEVLERAFMPVFTQQDLVNIAQFQMYLALSIDAVGSKPFSARSLPPIQKPDISYKDQVISASRKFYAKPRMTVEESIEEWFKPIGGSQPEGKQGASAPYNPNFNTQSKKTFDGVRTKEPTVLSDTKEKQQKPFVASYKKEKDVYSDQKQQSTQSKKTVSRSEQPAISDTLQTLINKIDAPVVKQQKEESAQETKPITKPEILQSRQISENNVVEKVQSAEVSKPVQKPELTRGAQDASKQALRDLLKKLNTNTSSVETKTASSVSATISQEKTITPQPVQAESVTVPPKEIPVVKKLSVEEKNEEAKEELVAQSQPMYTPKAPKEIPENILRSILE